MSEVEISHPDPRVRAVVELAGTGRPVVEVGAHDAALCEALVGSGAAPSAVAIDRSEASCAAARRRVGSLRIEVRHGEGLGPVAIHEAEGVLLLAGLGGRTIREVLGSRSETARRFHRWTLSPQSEVPTVRAFVAQAGRRLVEERMVEHAGQFYVVLAAEEGTERLEEPDLLLGPRLRRARPDAWCQWLAREEVRLARAAKKSTGARKAEILRQVAILRGAVKL